MPTGRKGPIDTSQSTRLCAQCGDPIPTDNARALYCSAKCNLAFNKAKRLAHLKEITPREQWPHCQQCGEPFLSLKPDQATCSARCARIMGARAINARRPAPQGPSQGDPASITRRATRLRGAVARGEPMGEDAARILWLESAQQWERLRQARKAREDAPERLVLVGYGCVPSKSSAKPSWSMRASLTCPLARSHGPSGRGPTACAPSS
jgi:predicted nucleic acid-binding Zn ribbon protein